MVLPARNSLALTLGAVFLLGCAGSTKSAETNNALILERKIPLGEVSGRIDHLAFDAGRQRLIVAELGNNTVGVVDLQVGKVIQRLEGLKEPQGVAYIADADMLMVANAGDGTVRRFSAKDFSAIGAQKLGDDADNIRVDASQGQVVVGYGSGALAIFDARSGEKLGEIALAGHPESFQLEKNGPRIFVNVPDAHEVAAVDRAARKPLTSWKLPDLRGNFPMAIDEASSLLAAVYRNPATVVLLDIQQGSVVGQIPTCGDADDAFFDTRRHRLYVSCGAGEIAILGESDRSYREVGRVPTASGARTSLWVPELDRLFVAVRAGGREPAAIWVFRPTT